MDILGRFREAVVGRDAVVVELGCCEGTATRRMTAIGREVCTSYRHLGVEADLRILHHALPSNPTASFVNVAVCEKDGDVLLRPAKWTEEESTYCGSSTIQDPRGAVGLWRDLEYGEPKKINGMRLDTLYRMHCIEEVDFLWVDIEGSELRMIEGGRDYALPRTRYMYAEYWDPAVKVYGGQGSLEDYAKALPGWALVEDYGGDALLRNRRLT